MISYLFKLYLHKWVWKKKNRHNFTRAGTLFNRSLVTVGNATYGEINAIMSNDNTRLIIGSYCSIAPHVAFIVSADHHTKTLSTYPFKEYVLGRKNEAISKGDIIIADDVWIGYGAIILSGVSIGQGSVVAAGAVVTKDVPPYAIVAGVPATIISFRFSKETIDIIEQVDYGKLSNNKVENHISMLYSNIDELQPDELRKRLSSLQIERADSDVGHLHIP